MFHHNLSRQTPIIHAVVQEWLPRVKDPSNLEFFLFKDGNVVGVFFIKMYLLIRGCSFSPCHVWSGLPSTGGIFGPLEGFVRTKVLLKHYFSQRLSSIMSHFQHRKSYPTNGNFGVYGIDCEMCYTIAGLELTKVN